MLIEVSNLSISIDKEKILKNLNFKIKENTLNILIGENGAGKSILLKTLAGFYNFYEGNITLKGKEVNSIDALIRARIISYVASEFHSTFSYTLYNIVEMGRYVAKKSDVENDKKIIEKTMTDLDIWHLKDKSIQEVSTGEKMRAFIARAIATEAEILLFDEPTSPLDIRHKTSLFNIIENLIKIKKTVIVSMHDLNDAIELQSNTIVLSKGNLIANGMSNEIINKNLIKKAYGVESRTSNAFVFFNS